MSKYPVCKIAICGQFRSGKDTVADYLAENYNFKKFAFADEMKRIMHELFPQIPANPKPRRAYQVFGEGLRSLDLPDARHVWINACMRKVETYIWWHSEVDDSGANVVITDLRTPEEYEHVKANGFTIVKVTAPVGKRLVRAKAAGDSFTEADLAHETESHIEGFTADYEIANDGTVDELWTKVDDMISAIGKR